MERAAAYRRKLSVIVEELEALPPSEADLSPLELRGVQHAVQVAIDAAMDVVAMRVRDLGHEVSDDHHNLDTLASAGILDAAAVADLRRLNGLRNAIVHKYNRSEDATLRESLDEIGAVLYAFIERMEAHP